MSLEPSLTVAAIAETAEAAEATEVAVAAEAAAAGAGAEAAVDVTTVVHVFSTARPLGETPSQLTNSTL
jgi:hypothetical protein